MMKRKTGRGPKDKGRKFEVEIRDAILAAFPGLSPYDVVARAMGDPGPDLILSQAARDLLGGCFELKRTEKLRLNDALAQVEASAAKEGGMPVLVFRGNNQPARAVILFSDFLKLLGGEAHGPID